MDRQINRWLFGLFVPSQIFCLFFLPLAVIFSTGDTNEFCGFIVTLIKLFSLNFFLCWVGLSLRGESSFLEIRNKTSISKLKRQQESGSGRADLCTKMLFFLLVELV